LSAPPSPVGMISASNTSSSIMRDDENLTHQPSLEPFMTQIIKELLT
jgi:hypothetical protein